jgi:hypothetical protein
MLNQIILRVIYAIISATILSIIGNYLSSKLEGLPRILRDGRFSGANQKTNKQKKRDNPEPNDCKVPKVIDASNHIRKEYRPRNSKPKNQRSKSQARVEQSRCKGAGETKLKSQRQCHNRNSRNLSDANVKDRAFSQRHYK